jgi:hypothetical protein
MKLTADIIYSIFYYSASAIALSKKLKEAKKRGGDVNSLIKLFISYSYRVY